MKLFLLFVAAVFISTSEVSSLSSGCSTDDYGDHLTCHDFQQSYLPYPDEYPSSLYRVYTISLYGNFSKIVIDPRFEGMNTLTIGSSNLQEFNLDDFTSFSKLRYINIVNSERVLNVNFTRNLSGLMYPNIWRFNFTNNKQIIYKCESLRSFHNYFHQELALDFHANQLNTFDLACLPNRTRYLDLSNNGITDLKFSGKDSDFDYFYEFLKEFKFQNNNITVISDEVCQYLQKVETRDSDVEIYLNSNQLKTFDLSCISKHINLLDLSNNSLTEIQFSDSSDSTPVVWSRLAIDLSYNNLSHITDETCRNFRKVDLQFLNLFLDYNEFTQFNFSCIPANMSGLSLSGNNITDFVNLYDLSRSPGSFTYLHGNCTCSLMWDYVKLIYNAYPGALSLLSETGSVGFVDIRCSGIDRYGIETWSTLGSWGSNYLAVYHDLPEIKESVDNVDHCFTNYLADTTVSDTSTSSIDGCRYEWVFGVVPKMECVDYTSTDFDVNDEYINVESLEIQGSFASLKNDTSYQQLRHLRIQSANLLQLDLSAFNGLNNLKSLDISHNYIQLLIFVGNAWNKPDLDEIDLRGNNLTDSSFPNKLILKIFSGLKRLNLGYNQLETFELNSMPRSLVYLYLANNQISTINFLEAELYTSLKSLDLSDNRLQSFALQNLPPNLKLLSLKGNSISNFNLIRSNPLNGIHLIVYNNSIDCDCEFFTDYIDVLKTGNVTVECEGSNCLDCHPESSLVDYPWTNRTTEMEKYDKTASRCLLEDENTDTVEENTDTLGENTDTISSLILFREFVSNFFSWFSRFF